MAEMVERLAGFVPELPALILLIYVLGLGVVCAIALAIFRSRGPFYLESEGRWISKGEILTQLRRDAVVLTLSVSITVGVVGIAYIGANPTARDASPITDEQIEFLSERFESALGDSLAEDPPTNEQWSALVAAIRSDETPIVAGGCQGCPSILDDPRFEESVEVVLQSIQQTLISERQAATPNGEDWERLIQALERRGAGEGSSASIIGIGLVCFVILWGLSFLRFGSSSSPIGDPREHSDKREYLDPDEQRILERERMFKELAQIDFEYWSHRVRKFVQRVGAVGTVGSALLGGVIAINDAVHKYKMQRAERLAISRENDFDKARYDLELVILNEQIEQVRRDGLQPFHFESEVNTLAGALDGEVFGNGAPVFSVQFIQSRPSAPAVEFGETSSDQLENAFSGLEIEDLPLVDGEHERLSVIMAALEACARATNPVRVRVFGFASSEDFPDVQLASNEENLRLANRRASALAAALNSELVSSARSGDIDSISITPYPWQNFIQMTGSMPFSDLDIGGEPLRDAVQLSRSGYVRVDSFGICQR